LSSPGGGAGGSVKVLDDIKDCLCNDMSAWADRGTPRSAATGILAATQPYDPNLEKPLPTGGEGINPVNVESNGILESRAECPADFTRNSQECAQATDIERSKAENKEQGGDIGAKLDALVVAFSKIETLPDAIGAAVKAAIEGTLGNLGTNIDPATGEEIVPAAATGEAGAVTTTGNMTLAWGDTLRVEHMLPITTPPDLTAKITEIVNNILRDSGLIQGHGKPVREGGIQETDRYA
jgi:hypothetical protein